MRMWPSIQLLDKHCVFFADTDRLNSLPLGEKINIEFAWLVLAMINIATFLPMLLLWRYGEKWRKASWQTPPASDDI